MIVIHLLLDLFSLNVVVFLFFDVVLDRSFLQLASLFHVFGHLFSVYFGLFPLDAVLHVIITLAVLLLRQLVLFHFALIVVIDLTGLLLANHRVVLIVHFLVAFHDVSDGHLLLGDGTAHLLLEILLV